jgi:molybdopterin converting factor small subunit
MKHLTLEYFAILREMANTKSESLDSDSVSALHLYQQQQQRYGWPLKPEQVGVAINGKFKPMETELQSGDHVVFIPPVAGG